MICPRCGPVFTRACPPPPPVNQLSSKRTLTPPSLAPSTPSSHCSWLSPIFLFFTMTPQHVEEHAFSTYDAYLAEHEEVLKKHPAPMVKKPFFSPECLTFQIVFFCCFFVQIVQGFSRVGSLSRLSERVKMTRLTRPDP